jgi:hypothetical protein
LVSGQGPVDDESLPDSGYSDEELTAGDLKDRWGPWIVECLSFISSDFYRIARLKYDMSLEQYPAVDLQIYTLILAHMRGRKPKKDV